MATEKKTTQFERVTQALATGDEGFYIYNASNGREVEVTNMAGGRYLCKDKHGEPCRQVDDEALAFNFLMGDGPKRWPQAAGRHIGSDENKEA